MPELPEVETVCRGLHRVMKGATITHLELRRANLRFPFPAAFKTRLTNARIIALCRRAKFLQADLSTGETLIMHLGMSGRFITQTMSSRHFHKTISPCTAHDHVIFHLRQGTARHQVIYNDPRRFGYMDLLASTQIEDSRHFKHLGPEPLSTTFSPSYLEKALSGKHTSIKQALLDQRVVAGLGNIYVCEALFQAKISPRRHAYTIPGMRAQRLVPAIQDILTRAITAGGSSLKDFTNTQGDLGYFQHHFEVYGRAGQSCGVCQHDITRIAQNGRSTFFCSRCQR